MAKHTPSDEMSETPFGHDFTEFPRDAWDRVKAFYQGQPSGSVLGIADDHMCIGHWCTSTAKKFVDGGLTVYGTTVASGVRTQSDEQIVSALDGQFRQFDRPADEKFSAGAGAVPWDVILPLVLDLIRRWLERG